MSRVIAKGTPDDRFPEHFVFVWRDGKRGPPSTRTVLLRYVALYGWPACEVQEATPEEVAAMRAEEDRIEQVIARKENRR